MEIAVGFITPLFDVLWNEFVLWSALVGGITFGWLYHHSFFYRSEEGVDNNVDNLQVGVFPAHYDNLKLEVTWTLVPFLLIVYLAFISWAPLDNIWSSPNAEDGYFGDECESGESSNLYWDSTDEVYRAECYHIFGITGFQWSWEFDCYNLDVDVCAHGIVDIEGNDKPLLEIKAGEAYLTRMTSTDVTHAPWFVSHGIKEDIHYGEITSQWVLADDVENFLLLCTEYCGDNHAYMIAGVSVHA